MKAQTLLLSSAYVSACERDGAKLLATMTDGKPSTLLNALTNGRIQVEEVRTVTKTVEDIYLTVVNHSEGRL